ncbi:MAG: TonB-dependent receptor, partial [Rhodocyclaceae bacterium]|nr:TonB-dependent receptor [Rhodocyclaceae bacterium]
MSTEEALSRLLAASGLTWTRSHDGAYAIKPVPAERVAELATVEVRGSPDAGTSYAVRRASAATKTDTPLMETPVSIQVVPRAILDDRQAMSLPDAVNGNVSGVLGRTGAGYLYDNFILRGFGDTSGFGTAYRNGLMNRQDIYDVSNVEQIEIVKGPAAVLYGRIEPGGMVNYVTKKPLDTPYHAIQQQIGSDHQFRTSVDTTGPLDENGTLLYRLNASYTDNESFRDFVGNERLFIAPTLAWRPTKDFEATVEVEYKRDRFQADIGIPAIGKRPADIPFRRSLSDGKERQTLENTLFAFDWTYRFNDDWKITQRFQQQDWRLGHRQILARALLADDRTMPRWANKGVQNVGTQAMNLDLLGKFALFGAKHELLIGLDEFRAETKTASSFFGAAPTIDIFDPVYGQLDMDTLIPNRNFYRKQRWSGVYVQDQITVFERLHFLADSTGRCNSLIKLLCGR